MNPVRSEPSLRVSAHQVIHYSPTYDVFGVIGHANDQGAFIFAPTRT
jgi:hypothetical protein